MDNANPISLLVLVLRRGAERHDCLIGNLWNVRYRVVFFFFSFVRPPPLLWLGSAETGRETGVHGQRVSALT